MFKDYRREIAIGILLLVCLGMRPSPCAAQQTPATAQIRQTVTFLDVEFTKGGQQWHEQGTGFFVFYPDKRLGESGGFVYLVTNRHVAQPEIDEGQVYPTTSTHVRLNLRKQLNGKLSEDSVLPINSTTHWYFPVDEAVDLAVLPIFPSQEKYDYLTFPISSFVTQKVVETQAIGEGDNVLFAGYFYQFPGMEKIEPIVREGVLALMPREPMQTTLHKNGLLYLADLHVFNGNSGSPLFVNVGGVRNGALTLGGFPYLLIGVVSGYYYENSDLTLTVVTRTITGKLGANSGIALVVPADQLLALLDSSDLQAQRDQAIPQMLHH